MTYLLTKQQFQLFQTRFKALAHAKKLTADHMLLHALVIGKSWQHCLTPITNPTTLRCQCKDNPLFNIIKVWNRVGRSVNLHHHASKYLLGVIVDFPGVFDGESLHRLSITLRRLPTLDQSTTVPVDQE